MAKTLLEHAREARAIKLVLNESKNPRAYKFISYFTYMPSNSRNYRPLYNLALSKFSQQLYTLQILTKSNDLKKIISMYSSQVEFVIIKDNIHT